MVYRTAIVVLIVASMACSRGKDRPVAASPTGPTASNPEGAIVFVGGVSGPMDVLFPGRGDSFLFRNNLETKYQTSLGRSAGGSFVDREGEVVWTQEYIRYRVNGCDHATAVQRVMTQIDGGAAGGICAAPPEGEVRFPSRADSLEFRRALETKYQQMGRGSGATFVDAEGAVIWIQEYLRYRTNGCDHATAEQKVFAQIDGGPVQDICALPCTLTAVPSFIDVGVGAMSGTFEVRPSTANCNIAWTATSSSSWLTFPAGTSPGGGYTTFPYSVAQNTGGVPRSGRITVSFAGGSTEFRVNQGGVPFNVGFTTTDPFRSGSQPTTECWLRSTATPCTFTAFANLPGNTYTYAWTATYVYGTTKSSAGTASSLTITDGCGGAGATVDGPPVELVVTLTVSDEQGNTVTVRSGEGNQPALVLRLFSC